MKKIIDHKVYNTETAELITSNDNGLSRSDFNVIEKNLYRTKRGQFFLHVFGGANTSYATKSNGFSSEGETIELINNEEALEILIEWGEIELVEKMFPGVIEEG